MPKLGTYIPANCHGHIGANIVGGYGAFPVDTPVEAKNVSAAVAKTIARRYEIHAPADWLARNDDEVRDTLIFEGINVINKPNLEATQTGFETTNQTLAAYGLAYSDIEADTAWRAGHIFNAMANAGINISVWATGLRSTVMNAVAFPNFGAFQPHFATTPQDPGANDQRQMNSEDLYQFEWVGGAGNPTVAKKVKKWLGYTDNTLNGIQNQRTRENKKGEIDRILGRLGAVSGNPNDQKKSRVTAYNNALKELYELKGLNDANSIRFPNLNAQGYICPTY